MKSAGAGLIQTAVIRGTNAYSASSKRFNNARGTTINATPATPTIARWAMFSAAPKVIAVRIAVADPNASSGNSAQPVANVGMATLKFFKAPSLRQAARTRAAAARGVVKRRSAEAGAVPATGAANL